MTEVQGFEPGTASKQGMFQYITRVQEIASSLPQFDKPNHFSSLHLHYPWIYYVTSINSDKPSWQCMILIVQFPVCTSRGHRTSILQWKYHGEQLPFSDVTNLTYLILLFLFYFASCQHLCHVTVWKLCVRWVSATLRPLKHALKLSFLC